MLRAVQHSRNALVHRPVDSWGADRPGAAAVTAPSDKSQAPGVASEALTQPAPVSENATQTTAEAIAAELAAADRSRPAVTMATFAPENLLPGTGLMARRRKPGASMSGFRSIASDLFKV